MGLTLTQIFDMVSHFPPLPVLLLTDASDGLLHFGCWPYILMVYFIACCLLLSWFTLLLVVCCGHGLLYCLLSVVVMVYSIACCLLWSWFTLLVVVLMVSWLLVVVTVYCIAGGTNGLLYCWWYSWLTVLLVVLVPVVYSIAGCW